MDLTNILISLGLPIATLLVGLWLARQKMPYENRVSQSNAYKSDAEGDKVRAETITIQNNTIAGLVQQISTQNGTIFGMQNTQNAQTNEINNLNAKVARQDLEIARLTSSNESLLGEVAAGHKREDELKKLTVQQRALIDAIPERMDLYDMELAKLGVVLPRNEVFEAARAAIDKQEDKVAGGETTTPAQDTAKAAIELVSIAIDEAKKPPPPAVPPESDKET